MKLLKLALFVLFTPLSVHAGELDIKVNKVTNSTAVGMTIEGRIDSPVSKVSPFMCDYGEYTKLSKSYMAKHVITEEAANKIIKEPFGSAGDAMDFVEKTPAIASTCPGVSYVILVQNMPWPLANTWSVNKYIGKIKEETLYLNFHSLAASHKGSSGSYVIKPNQDGSSNVLMAQLSDLGFRVPKFVITWAVSKQIPKMFSAIEREANLVSASQQKEWQQLLISEPKVISDTKLEEVTGVTE